MAHTSKCKTKPCNCADQGLTTQPPCAQNTPDCPDPEQCAETFSGECIIYTGDTIVDNDIQYGDRFNEIIQKLTLMILNPNCTDIASPCLSALGLMSTALTTTTASFKWDAVTTALTYEFSYKEATALVWTTIPAIPISAFPTRILTGLTANTDYHVRVTSVCATGACFSLTILIRTKPI